ncbi:MAG: serine/threonine-protein kinase, partial [Gemmataceae bacterium]
MNKAGVESGGPASLLAHLWQLNQRPDVHEILRQAGSLTTAQIISVLCVEQFQRWQRGERLSVEDLVRQYPYLHDADELVDLIFNEYMLREEQGESPNSGEYCHRFPHLLPALQRRFQVHRKDRGAKLSLLGAVEPPPQQVETPALVKRRPWPELKNYEIIEEVGRGGMGRVYKARHVRLDRIVALKLVNFHRLSDDERIIRRFEREARAAAQLNHPNIVLIYDFDFDEKNELYYISMEYVEGRDLLRIVQESGPLSMAAACDYMRQAALGLQHAFESGMVHRDIKPPNLLVTTPNPSASENRGIVKILDMGLVLVPEEGGSHLTQQGMVVGTPDYMAPEQT